MRNGTNYPILMGELKKILRRKKIRYKDLAESLEMSESSVKRLMSAEDASLSKLEAICEVAGISFFDLVSLCKDEKAEELFLSPELVKFFSKNTHYFYFFHLLYEEGMSVQEVAKQYSLNSKSVTKYLRKLEDLELLEWHPGDKVKFLVRGRISIPDMNDLGTHLFQTTISNLSNLICNPDEMRARMGKKKNTFSISECYLKPEVAEGFYRKLGELAQEMSEASDRAEKVFEHDELELYTSIFGIMPVRLYYEDVMNLS